VLYLKDDLWVVVDRIDGAGEHSARLHWLGGDLPHEEPRPGAMRLLTEEGTFEVAVFDEAGRPLAGDLVRGGESPPRGWLSRYYGEKVPVPSLAVERRGRTPLTFVSVLSVGAARCTVEGQRWIVSTESTSLEVTLEDGLPHQVQSATIKAKEPSR
jgi:asparagine synthase (glutamine-hydrolysing)